MKYLTREVHEHWGTFIIQWNDFFTRNVSISQEINVLHPRLEMSSQRESCKDIFEILSQQALYT